MWKYQYADLNVIIDATVPVLGQHGLLLVQAIEDSAEGQLRITSTLFHAASGQWMGAEVSVPKPDDMQNFGMTCTYVKRYAQQALLNISTEDDDDAASLNGSSKPATSKPVATPAASTNGHQPPVPTGLDATQMHPTEANIAALYALAVEACGESRDVIDDRIRRALGVKAGASVAPKLLSRSMPMAAFMAVYEHYTRVHAQLARPNIQENPSDGPQPTTPESAIPQPTPAPVGEGTPADPQPSPDASLSAPAPAPDDAAKRDRDRLRQEVSSWPLLVSPDEVEFILKRHPYSQARQLLWGARRQKPVSTLMAPAAEGEGVR